MKKKIIIIAEAGGNHNGSLKSAYKLVDRLEFSRQNFNAAKNWVKG